MVTTGLVEAAVRALPVKIWQGLAEWVRIAFGKMATGEFWLKLLETIITQMVNAFMITLGGKLLTYGVSREDPEVKNTKNIYGGQQAATAATAAFNGAAVRQDYAYQRPADYRNYAAPVRAPLDKSFPESFNGFGGPR